MESPPKITCSFCHTALLPSARFCHHCGRPLYRRASKTTPPATTASKQIIVYLVSFFLAPLGLYFAWKYLKQNDPTSKIIGAMAIVLTIFAIVVASWTMSFLFDYLMKYIDLLRNGGF